jgi:tetratricopeptide (TPR) repeat protein
MNAYAGGVDDRRPNPEDVMSRSCSHALAAAVLLSTVFGASRFAAAVDTNNPTPPAATQTTAPGATATPSATHKAHKKAHKKPKTTAQKTSSAEDFLSGYHAAHALIYDRGDYQAGIVALHAIGHDEHPDVATLLGYASRKLGRYDDAKYWYEHALAADPDHAVTWSYYGMWQAEQGNVLKAKDDLEKVRSICGTDCRAYTELKSVIEGTKIY